MSLMPSMLVLHSVCHPREGSRPRGRAVLGWLTAVLFCASPASASQVFYSPNDDGLPSAGPSEVPPGLQSVYLYIDGGALASSVDTACDTGSGNEICGYTLTLTGLTGLTLASFTPDGSADLLHALTGAELRVNGLDTMAPTPGPKRIGELMVNAVVGGSLDLTAGEAIGADLSSETLPVGQVVAVPEPGVLLQFASGSALLLYLRRRRVFS